ncbi:MAG TPA: zinc-dependent metalloprotease [Actinomycetota bacterium]|nr:zinc-dependent metalloprotease [Actinomycetota bacterium]
MDIDPMEMAAALAQIPLFRELQRLLMSQTGPVNWEVAGQIARGVAQVRGPGTSPTRADFAAYEEACRLAQMRVTQLTGLESPSSITKVDLADRTAWVNANLDALRPFVERLAKGLQSQFGSAAGGFAAQFGLPQLGGSGEGSFGEAGEGPGGLEGPMGAASLGVGALFGMLGPLILGLEIGFLVGFLSREVLGNYDLCLPRGDAGTLWFVMPNIAEAQSGLEVDPRQFQMYLALHEVAHQLEFTSIRWVRPHFTGMVERFIDAAEIDSSEAMNRLQALGDPEQLQRLMSHPEELLPMLITPPQQELAREIETLMAVLEGYAEWIVDQIGSEMLPESAKIREGLSRRRAERSTVERLLEGLLGIDLKPAQYRAGVKFVAAVAAAGQLGKLWESARALPAPAELTEPAKWLSRVAFS